MNTQLDLFVSQTEHDKPLVTALLALIDTALKIPSRRIRCTGVPGHNLSGGDDVSATLRDEIRDCKVFLAVLTEASNESFYVASEIGARWFGGGTAIILRGGGFAPKQVRGPLADTHSYDLSSATDLLQLVRQLATALEQQAEPADHFHARLRAVIEASEAAACSERNESSTPAEVSGKEVSNDEADRFAFGDSRITHIVVDSAIHPIARRALRDEIIEAHEKQSLLPTKLLYATQEGATRWVELADDPSYAFFQKSRAGLEDPNAKLIAKEISKLFPGEVPDLVSLGSGEGQKDAILINELHDVLLRGTNAKINYFPIDYSYFLINRTIETFRKKVTSSKYRIKPIVGDLCALHMFSHVYEHFSNPDLFAILGNTIGNNDESALMDAIDLALHSRALVLIEVNLDVPADPQSDFVRGDKNKRHNFSPFEALGQNFDDAEFSVDPKPGTSSCDRTTSFETSCRLKRPSGRASSSTIPPSSSTIPPSLSIFPPGASELEVRVALNHRYHFPSFCEWAERRLHSKLVWKSELQNNVGLALFKPLPRRGRETRFRSRLSGDSA